MEQSLYFEYVQKYFPELVLQIIERINEKRGTSALTYLFMERLRPMFSVDGRWASILAEYNRVAADVVSLDSELPLKSRDSIEAVTGEIPKLGMKLYLTEKQMDDIDAMIAQGLPITNIIDRIFNDLPRCITGIFERIEDMFLSGLSSGVAVNTRNNGTGVRVDYGYLDANKFATTIAAWDDSTNAVPMADMQQIVDKAILDSNVLTDAWLDDTALNNLYKNQQVREQYAFDNQIAVQTGSAVPSLDLDKVAQVFLRKWGIQLHRVARTIKTELNGVKESHNPWQTGAVVFTCDEMLGDLAWAMCAEAKRPVANVEYQTANEYILLSKYSTNDPLREFTSSQAKVVPVINNVDRIYTLDSTTVSA